MPLHIEQFVQFCKLHKKIGERNWEEKKKQRLDSGYHREWKKKTEAVLGAVLHLSRITNEISEEPAKCGLIFSKLFEGPVEGEWGIFKAFVVPRSELCLRAWDCLNPALRSAQHYRQFSQHQSNQSSLFELKLENFFRLVYYNALLIWVNIRWPLYSNPLSGWLALPWTIEAAKCNDAWKSVCIHAIYV